MVFTAHRGEDEGEDGGGDSDNNKLHCNQDYNQVKVINLSNFKSHHYSDARILSDKPVFVPDTNDIIEGLPSDINFNDMPSNDQQQTYTGMLKLSLRTLSYEAFGAL